MRTNLDAQYQKAAMALAAGVRDGKFRSILFTGPAMSPGTTSTILGVADQLKVSCGLNPLVVELNRLRPAFTRLFHLDENRSVASVAAGSSSRDCVQRSPNGVAMIPIGDFSSMNSNANFALTEAVVRIQEELRGEYDLILWDAPPVLEHPDVLALRAVLPCVVLVIESGKSRHEVLERIKREFADAGMVLVGSIMVKQQRPIPGWIYRWLVH
jgi:Mrp family chromosome partitioning ATPase